MTTPIDKAQLRALAEAATPGPWFSVSRGQYWGEDEGDVRQADDQDVVGAEFVKPIGDVDTTRGQAWRRDTDFIAAANPATILALLDDLEHADRYAEQMGRELSKAHAEVEALRADAARWQYAMDWDTKKFAVCMREGTSWSPIKNDGPIDHAMEQASKEKTP